jgi:broad specificity phosphatase PhoE
VRRFWQGIVDEVARGPRELRVFVCTHSGPIRAVATAAFGHDPGEPYNLEDVRMRVFDDGEHAVVTYRERALEIEVPTLTTVSWSS